MQGIRQEKHKEVAREKQCKEANRKSTRNNQIEQVRKQEHPVWNTERNLKGRLSVVT